jgi:hypothetical protein
MEGLARLVSDSLARHGFTPAADSHRLQWSRWFRCESSFSLLLLPSEPGLFALAEEIVPAGETATTGGKRMLAVLQVSEADDLGLAMGRLFSPGNPLHKRVSGGRCFARYVIISDEQQRHSVASALQKWIANSAESASGLISDFTTSLSSSGDANQGPHTSGIQAAPDFGGGIGHGGSASVTSGTDNAGASAFRIDAPASLPSGF